MNVKTLAIYIGKAQRVGVLLQYAMPGAEVINRFVVDDDFIRLSEQPSLSLSFKAETPEDQAALWRSIRSSEFNGRASAEDGSALLPPFFQNLLPEGVFRTCVAENRGCGANDHFEILAACGKDLPGNVYALPVELSREDLSSYIAGNSEALEMNVTADPLEGGVSLSGVQPKLSVLKDSQRYVGRSKNRDTNIIAKLPVVGRPRLPELEHLSLQLARAAGVDVCEAHLVPLEQLDMEHGYDLGDATGKTKFLAVMRYDRSPEGRIHCEDFAQILGEMPEDKYSGVHASYLEVAATLMSIPELGEQAVHELLRRIMVAEMMGNVDYHLKNIGLRYPDGKTAEFPPAYDVVAYAALIKISGHAMRILPADLMPYKAADSDGRREKPSLTPSVLRAFVEALDIPEKPAQKVLRDCARAAYENWPGMIMNSELNDAQKARLIDHFYRSPPVASLRLRAGRTSERNT
jgi:serine/threonine-protein kinase HipA